MHVGTIRSSHPLTSNTIVPFFTPLSIEKTGVVNGTAFRKLPCGRRSVVTKRRATVMLIATGVMYDRSDHVLSSHDSLVEGESAFLDIKVRRILRVKPDVLMCGGRVCGEARERLEAEGVVVVGGVKASVLERVARVTGGAVWEGLEGRAGRGENALTTPPLRLATLPSPPPL